MATTFRLSRMDEPPPVAKVTDVRQLARRLCTCASCGGAGDKRRLLSLVSIGIEGLHHGTCAVQVLTPAQVLSLPHEQTSKLRLNETGVELMRQLLDRGTRCTQTTEAARAEPGADGGVIAGTNRTTSGAIGQP